MTDLNARMEDPDYCMLCGAQRFEDMNVLGVQLGNEGVLKHELYCPDKPLVKAIERVGLTLEEVRKIAREARDSNV